MITKTLVTLAAVASMCYPLAGGGGMRTVAHDSREDIQTRIYAAAKAKGLNPAVALAVAQVESTFKTGVCRGERKSQSCGLFQVWVPTARYLKFTGPETDLAKSEISIELGTTHLQMCQKRYGHDVSKIACCHNAGLQRPATRCSVDPGVAEYVSKVNAAYLTWNARVSE